MAEHWTKRITGFEELEPSLRDDLERAGRVIDLPKGTRLFGPGQAPQTYLLLLSGDIKVSQVAESGREIVLYRVLPGESCALTTACLLGDEDYNAEAVAETDIQAVAIPRSYFEDLMSRSAEFRRFVLRALSRRVTDLFKLVDEIAFQRMDVRIAHKLLELAGGSCELSMTHQQLASELGTAREVVSRQLHEFHRRGWINSGRGNLRIVDRGALERLAGEA